jgi:FMN-dependent oxidoreductase (nitrilotriacetate monooxygenase family)
MTKQLRLNAFAMNTISHLSPGLWTHPRDQSVRYTDLEFWADLARTLERGLFDGIFLADVLGIYDVFGGTPAAAIRRAAQMPVNDPLQLVPAMALVTKHLGFGITCSVSFEHPYPFARRMSTLDHLTKGRMGWNIVTSYLESGARNLGQDSLAAHDDRYEIADEYLDVCYKLWEASWEDDAVVRDFAHGIYTDPGKVHSIGHKGKHFSVPGIHLCEPSPQRTPLLYQAGASKRGRQFAAKHAECVFVGAPSITVLKKTVAGIRDAVAEQGRDPHDVLIFSMLTAIVGETDRAASEKFADYKKYFNLEGALALLGGWTGVDLSTYALDQHFTYVQTNAAQSMVEGFSAADPNRTWTVREMAEWCGIGGRGGLVVGSPATVSDYMQKVAEEADINGYNLAYAALPETFTDIADLLIPELQRRGVYKTTYQDGTLREKLFSGTSRLRKNHYGRTHQRAAEPKP